MALPRGAMGLSAVCDCGISRSYSLTIFGTANMTFNFWGVHCIFVRFDSFGPSQ